MNKITPEIQQEIQNQIDNNVVLYNIKDKNAFFVISPEEARFALDIIKKRRVNTTHTCTITELKDQKFYKEQKHNKSDSFHKNGLFMFSQHLSTIQLAITDEKGEKAYYSVANDKGRGTINSINADPIIFDVALRPNCDDIHNKKHLEKTIRTSFISIIKEKVNNDLNTYAALLDQLNEDNRIDYDDAMILPSDLKQDIWDINSKNNIEYLEDKVKNFASKYNSILELSIRYVNTTLPFIVKKGITHTAHLLTGRNGRKGKHNTIPIPDQIVEGEEILLVKYDIDEEQIKIILNAFAAHIKSFTSAYTLHLLIDMKMKQFGMTLIQL